MQRAKVELGDVDDAYGGVGHAQPVANRLATQRNIHNKVHRSSGACEGGGRSFEAREVGVGRGVGVCQRCR